MSMPPLWFWGKDPLIGYQFDKFLLSDDLIGIWNTRELGRAEDELRDTAKSLSSDDVLWPDGFPAPLLALPDRSFAADFLSFGSYDFLSGRLRDAIGPAGPGGAICARRAGQGRS